MKTYKNKTDRELVIVGVGVVKPNGTIKTNKTINNQNLELLKKENTEEKVSKINKNKEK